MPLRLATPVFTVAAALGNSAARSPEADIAVAPAYPPAQSLLQSLACETSSTTGPYRFAVSIATGVVMGIGKTVHGSGFGPITRAIRTTPPGVTTVIRRVPTSTLM